MAMSDVALQALLGYQAEAQARRLAQYDALPKIVPTAINNFMSLQELERKRREDEIRFGAPARGTPAAVNVGAPPEDPRRRFLGIPMGRAPQPAVRIMPDMAGNVPGAIGASDVPLELLAGDARAAVDAGQPVFFRPASPNFRPGTLGLDEFKARADILPYVSPRADGGVADLLTNPDRTQALRGAQPKVKAGNTTFLPVTDDLRERSMQTYGYDVFEGMDSIPLSTFNQTLRSSTPGRTPSPKEGDHLMDAATTRQLYQDEGMTAEEIAKAPKQLKARDYKARRGRLNAKARGGLLEALVGLAGSGATAPRAGDAVSEGFGF